MSKFVSSSIWNFIANFFMRIISIGTFPFLVRYYLREDIAIFKSFQAYVLILMAIIPIGTNILYLSVSQEEREKRWNLFFYTSLLIAIGLAAAIYLIPRISGFFIEDSGYEFVKYFMILVPLMEGVKIILITRLSSTMDFKSISIALIVKQFFLYMCLIAFAYIKPILLILLVAVFISELIELIMLYGNCLNKKVQVFPKLEHPLNDKQSKLSSWFKSLHIDKIAKKYITCSGIEQIFITFAVQFPTVFVVIILGKALAPEFQLPFAAVAMPVSLVMNSVARVSFPHYSNLREDERIINSLFSVLFPITFLLFPAMAGIHFFAAEISHLFLDTGWTYAVFALQVFPLIMIIYMLNMPSTFISNIKGKPMINLIYAIALFSMRMLGIYIGYQVGGFYGTILLFCLGDLLVRSIRIKIDIDLLSLQFKRYFACIKYNLYSFLILIVVMWGTFFVINRTVDPFPAYMSKIISFTIAISISLSLNYLWEKERVKTVFNKLHEQITLKNNR